MNKPDKRKRKLRRIISLILGRKERWARMEKSMNEFTQWLKNYKNEVT